MVFKDYISYIVFLVLLIANRNDKDSMQMITFLIFVYIFMKDIILDLYWRIFIDD